MSDIPWWWMLLNNLRISCWTITFGSLISSNYLVTWSIFLTNNVDLSKHVYKDIFDRFIPCHFSSTCQQVKNQVIFWNLQDSYGHKLVRCWSPSVSLTSLHPASRLSICRSPLRRQSDWSFGRWLAILCQSLRVQVSLFCWKYLRWWGFLHFLVLGEGMWRLVMTWTSFENLFKAYVLSANPLHWGFLGILEPPTSISQPLEIEALF